MFLHSFKVPGVTTWFEIRINDRGNLEVADIATRKFHVFSGFGELLASVPASESGGRYEEFAFDVVRSAVDIDGAILRVEGGQLIRELRDGQIEVLVKRSRLNM